LLSKYLSGFRSPRARRLRADSLAERIPALALLLALVACDDAKPVSGSPEAVPAVASAVGTPDTTAALPVEITQAPPASAAQQFKFTAPRYSAAVRLTPVWKRGGHDEADPVGNPVAVRFTTYGILVSDALDYTILRLASESGAELSRRGRGGRGPWEFVDYPVIVGTYAAPLVVEAPSGRVYTYEEEPSTMLSVTRQRPWGSACQYTPGELLLQAAPRPTDFDFFVSTYAELPAAVDSLSNPIPSIRPLMFFARQTSLRQAGDGTCALLPIYQPEFAVMRADRSSSIGRHIESLPIQNGLTEPTERGAIYSMAPGATMGPVDAARWRDYLLVLFEGKTKHRRRIVDMYRIDDLEYAGSFLLPSRSLRIDAHQDSLIVIGEEDEFPTLSLFVIKPTQRAP
jgi:hypothetical protein